jgi:hypothetical protein
VAIGSALYSSSGDLITSDLAGGVWAEDSSHLCEVRGPNGGPPGAHSVQTSPNTLVGVPSPAWLYVSSPGQSRRPVVQVGYFNDEGNVEVVSCSLRADEAVVASSFTVWIKTISVYRLSTGALLYSATPAPQVFGVAVTHDGRLLAEDDSSCGGTVIRDLSRDGQIVGHIQGSYVKAFSWNGAQVLTNGPSGNPSYVPASVAIRTLATATAVWSDELPPSEVDVQPSGSGFMLGVPPISAGYEPLSESAFIVNGQGAVTPVVSSADIAVSSGLVDASVGATTRTHAC